MSKRKDIPVAIDGLPKPGRVFLGVNVKWCFDGDKDFRRESKEDSR